MQVIVSIRHHRVAAMVAFASMLSAAAPAGAENPYDTEQRRLARQAEADGKRPEGLKPLLELWGNYDYATPLVTLAEIERLAQSRRLSPPRRAFVQGLLARSRRRMGDVETSNRLVRELGYVADWRVVGPFDNEGKSGFEKELPPESVRSEPLALDATWPGKERPVSWRPYPALSSFGYVSFDDVFRPHHSTCGFAETFIHSERAQPVTLWVGAGGAVRVYWNGEPVLEDTKYRAPDPERHVAMVGAAKGPNRLLVKVCATDGAWGFFLRTGDASGGPPVGLRADPNDAGTGAIGAPPARLPPSPKAALELLENAAAGERASARVLETLAFVLAVTGADDPAENRARQLAKRAAEREPNVDRLELAMALSEQRGEAMAFAERAHEIAPRDPKVLLMRARLRRGSPMPEDALPILDQLPERGMEAIEGALLRADVMRDLEFPQTALSILEQNAKKAPGSPLLLRELAEAHQALGHADRAIELRHQLLETRWDDLSNRRVVLADALRRREAKIIDEQVEALRTLASNVRDLSYLASVHESLGRIDDALEAFEQARALAPEEPTVLISQGRLLLRLDQPEAAALAFRDALHLRPQDADTRELLEQLRPREREDERYAIDARELLARRWKGNGFPSSLLQNLTVNTVYENGLGSSFRQIAAQIHDDEGARRWRTYSIQFDPGSQRVQIRHARVHRADGRVLEATRTFEQSLGEPWYRVYYDSRALVVIFPDLRPGDVVELKYRIDDVSHRNLFADYYGDLHFLDTFTPIRRLDYILITPKKRSFYFNEPSLAGLSHAKRVEGDRRIDHFHAENVPAIREEGGLPGMTEIASYLHVSTYRTWEDIGRWYWGLVKDQLYADESLRKTVRELVAGAPDTRTKVERILHWVLDNTRYVGLEFGIHGYKPYRVPQIVQRGFGDCKDKASLLFTMFREAGIDSHLVLVRTRRNGAIPDLPASLAVFDHAIAYVPELDRYLDGTAEHSGTDELPLEDQGVTVLHVWPGGSELRRTPVLGPDQNGRTRRIEVALARDGSAVVDVAEEIRGDEAASYRRTYQAEGTRSERFERSVRSLFPGLRLASLDFESLTNREEPVRFRYRAEVPKMAHADGDTLRLSPSVIEDLVRSTARTEGRKHPLELGGKRSYTEERIVRFPTGTRARQLPSGGEASSEFGRLALSIEEKGREIVARTTLEFSRDRIAPNEYPAFREWIESADRLLKQRITIGQEER